MLKLACIFSLFFIMQQAYGSQHFSCGKSDVKIYVVPDTPIEGGADGVIEVRSGKRKIMLRYDAGWFIGGTCSDPKGSKPMVIYQAFCLGCDDAFGWGVIDPVTLRVLLYPADTAVNRAKAEHLTQNSSLPVLTRIPIYEEYIDGKD